LHFNNKDDDDDDDDDDHIQQIILVTFPQRAQNWNTEVVVERAQVV